MIRRKKKTKLISQKTLIGVSAVDQANNFQDLLKSTQRGNWFAKKNSIGTDPDEEIFNWREMLEKSQKYQEISLQVDFKDREYEFLKKTTSEAIEKLKFQLNVEIKKQSQLATIDQRQKENNHKVLDEFEQRCAELEVKIDKKNKKIYKLKNLITLQRRQLDDNLINRVEEAIHTKKKNEISQMY